MDVYLITVDDHQKSMKKYYICVTKSAANMLFNKIIEERYFDSKKDMKEDLKEACNHMFWESQNGDIIACSKYHALTEEEIKDNKILSLFTECMIK